MQRQTLRTATLRLLAFGLLLMTIVCCAGPGETVEEASEAMSPIPPLNPSLRWTVAPRPTVEELAQMEQFLRDNLPKWQVYLSGQDHYFGTEGVRGADALCTLAEMKPARGRALIAAMMDKEIVNRGTPNRPRLFLGPNASPTTTEPLLPTGALISANDRVTDLHQDSRRPRSLRHLRSPLR